jgi:UDP-glucose 4-epimerase
LASHVSGIRSLELVLPTFTGNLCASVNLLIAATEAGCNKIVMAGSLEEPEMGNTHLVPCSPYAAAKWASSAYARMFHALYQTPVVIARPGMVYGQGQNDNSKLVPYVINSLINGNKPKLSKGDRLADWIHVDDVVDGLITMAKASNVEGKIIDIGSGELVSVRDVVRIIYTLMGATEEPIFGAIENRPMEQKRRADRSETLNLIGWEPVINLTQGLATTIEWYRARV